VLRGSDPGRARAGERAGRRSRFAYFDGWAKIALAHGTPACQAPIEDSVVVAWARGLPDRHFDQQAGCNGHSLDVIQYPAFRGDRVALVDARTPVDTSATCNTGTQPWDGDPTSGTHGLALAHVAFDPTDPPSDWLVRYAGDDGVIIASSKVGPVTYTFRRWTWFGNAHGGSTEVIDTLNTASGQVVRVEDGRVVQFASSTACKGSMDDPNEHVRFEIDGLLYIDPRHDGQIVGFGQESGSRHALRNVLAWGDAEASCPAVRGGSVRDSWIHGWNRLVGYQVTGVDRVVFAGNGGPSVGTLFGGVIAGESATIENFVAMGLPPAGLVNAGCGSGCDLTMRNGFAQWRKGSTTGLGLFYDTASLRLAAPLEGLLLARGRLLDCSVGWGARNGANIGTNLLAYAPGRIAINHASNCPLAAPQWLRWPSPLELRADEGGRHFGPVGRVGLAEDQTITADADLASSFAISATPCDDGVDDDGDGAVDLADGGCESAADPSETDVRWACGDGIADAPDDPSCPRPPPPQGCGLGFELVALVWLAARRSRLRA